MECLDYQLIQDRELPDLETVLSDYVKNIHKKKSKI